MGIGIKAYRIPISKRCNGYYLRWYYNGWHYWLWYPGRIGFITEGEKYRTLGTQTLTIGSGQITEEQVKAIRTIKNTKEINIYTDSGWGVVRLIPGSVITYNNQVSGYEVEITIIIGSKQISKDGFSPAISIPVVDPSYEYCETMCIGTQVWMCKNHDSKYPGSKVYDNDETNRLEYGGLYKHSQVMASGFAPAGWHVPTIAEWTTLITECGGVEVAGEVLKEAGTDHWLAAGGIDTYSFSAVGGGRFGFVYPAAWQYLSLKEKGFFWAQNGFIRMDYDNAAITIDTGVIFPNEYHSVRLLKDGPCAITPIKYGLLYNWYATIGFKDWFLPSEDELHEMYSELYGHGVGNFDVSIDNIYWSSTEIDNDEAKVITFSTGLHQDHGKAGGGISVRACRSFTTTDIYNLRDVGPAGGLIFHIIDLGGGSYTYFEAAPANQTNDSYWSNVSNILIGTTSAIIGEGVNNTAEIIAQAEHTDSAAQICDDLLTGNGIARAGWHIPTNANYDTLIAYLGGGGIAGGKLKEMGFTYWDNPNTGATNEIGFNARGSGARDPIYGHYINLNNYMYLWSANYSGLYAFCYIMEYNCEFIGSWFNLKKWGLSVRLVKDSTTLTHGQTGTYTGNDGKVYRTICIGTQEWLADNLAETKYNNGDLIPEITDNVAWAALTSGALCAYDNDWDNV